MTKTSETRSRWRSVKHLCTAAVLVLLSSGPTAGTGVTTTISLADQPVLAGTTVPGNLALVLSVEFPTANSVANLGDYSDSQTYLGYFDPAKCYDYSSSTTDSNGSYFVPSTWATGTNNHSCSHQWSGNFMNWATMQTIDPFRWALSGGYRSVDTATLTILEKAWASGQGDTGNYPDRGTVTCANWWTCDITNGNQLSSSLVSSVTPFTSWNNFKFRIEGNGNRMVFSSTGTAFQRAAPQTNLQSTTATADLSSLSTTNPYQVYVRVKVCDPSTTAMGANGLESNCVRYSSAWKPEGLLQKYSDRIRFSAFGYLNGDGASRQGGVLREPMGFIGPMVPQLGTTAPATNGRTEWNSGDGTMIVNPDAAAVSASVTASDGAGSVSNSGVMNYLNKFGESAHSYMQDDNVSELYYAALRYFENKGNVNDWISGATGKELDGFPAIASWSDPIAYSCQKNFILGIGDDHTHVDYNVAKANTPSTLPSAMTVTGGRGMPSGVSSDRFNAGALWTYNLEMLEGSPSSPSASWALGAGQATYYIAGLAYGAHVLDLRADLPDTQTISTYWMDVMEYQRVETLNPYYLAAKYGGFTIPGSGYDISNITTPLAASQWNKNGNSITMSDGASYPQPDNYFLAGNANQMVTGLRTAFANIAKSIQAYTTALSPSDSVVTSAGTTSFASKYESGSWTSVVQASTLTLDSNGNPSTSVLWSSDSKLQTQFSGTGWDTGRRVVTWDNSGQKGVAFRSDAIPQAQLDLLSPSSYATSSTTTAMYLKYLRGDQSNETSSSSSGSTKSLRTRTALLGDIIDSKITHVGAPSQPYADGFNPGYSAFKNTWKSRLLIAYAGANDGMLHAFNGSDGSERFAYVPYALYQGPNNTPQVDGLAALGNPTFTHHFYVDATPWPYDIDLANAGGNTGTPNWRTLLIGGLGKGGRSYYAIDVTDPSSMTSETTLASNIKWEFTHPTMGYSYGPPLVFKTAKYGWVVALTSGYNSSATTGFLYLLDPGTGVLLEKIATSAASSGLTYADAYIQNGSDGTADAVYAGDLNGQVWRFELTATSGDYPAATLLATLKDSSGNAQPVTTAPAIDVSPTSLKRYIFIGTGEMLNSADLTSSQVQTFYAIVDGTYASFAAVSSPATRSTLQAVSNASGLSTPSSSGWYNDLGTGSNIAYRMTQSAKSYYGQVTYASLLPVGDVCTLGGRSNEYVRDFDTGKSLLLDNSGGTIDHQTTDSPVEDSAYLQNGTGGKTGVYIGTASGQIQKLNTQPPAGTVTRLINWREIPTVE